LENDLHEPILEVSKLYLTAGSVSKTMTRGGLILKAEEPGNQ